MDFKTHNKAKHTKNRRDSAVRDTGRDYLEEYMLICKELFLEMERTGNWPWSVDESPKSENLVEFKDNNNTV